MRTVTMGFTPDPDDAFAAFALAHGKVSTGSWKFCFETGPIEELNRRASRCELDVVAISSVHFPFVQSDYEILRSGASVGRGYGPVLVSREPRSVDELKNARVAVPGLTTTGAALLRLALPHATVVAAPFEAIRQLVQAGQVDAGVLIHEELLRAGERRLHKVICLGKDWSSRTDLPLPVGLNVIRRDLPEALRRDFCRSLRQSIQYGLTHPDEAFEWAKSFGRSPTPAAALRFVRMFANDDTVHFDAACEEGLRVLLRRLERAGLAPAVPRIAFVEPTQSGFEEVARAG